MRFRRKTLTSPRLQKKRRKVLFRRVVLGGALAFSIFLAVRIILNSDFFMIKSIEVIGAKTIPSGQVKSLVASEINDSNFSLFSKRNFLFVDAEKINALVEKSFPDFSKVRTTLAGFGSLVVEVVERVPYANWCYEQDKKQCAIIDDKGFAFGKDKTTEATTTLNIFTGTKPIYGTELFDANRFSKLRQLINDLTRAGFTVNSVTESGTDYFVKIYNSFEIQVKSDEDPNSIAGKLTLITNNLKKENSLTAVDYIDLRYGNKVYLKRK